MASVAETLKKKVAKRRLNPRLKLLSKLLSFDDAIKSNFAEPTIIGVDEVGRGCLAGPVVAAASILPNIELNSALALSLADLNDSKQVLPLQRRALSLILREHTVHAIAAASVEEIDQLNIYHASLLAMQRAVTQVIEQISASITNIVVIVDGKAKIPQLNCQQKCIVKGDGLSASIAAASIIAKVHRDQIMIDLAEHHPNYQWHSNKGYGSRTHREAIISFGPNIWHRRTFLVKVLQTSQQLELELDAEYEEILD
jgi:ribonuclease HII